MPPTRRRVLFSSSESSDVDFHLDPDFDPDPFDLESSPPLRRARQDRDAAMPGSFPRAYAPLILDEDNDDDDTPLARLSPARRQQAGNQAGPSRPRQPLRADARRSRPASTRDVDRPAPPAGPPPPLPRGEPRLRRDNAAIDLTADDSDDEPVVTGANIIARAPPPPPRPAPARPPENVRQEDFRREMEDIDRLIAARGRAVQAIEQEYVHERNERARRELFSPPPRRPAQRIGLGGAVMRRGGTQVNYDNQGGRRARAAGYLDPDPDYVPDFDFEGIEDTILDRAPFDLRREMRDVPRAARNYRDIVGQIMGRIGGFGRFGATVLGGGGGPADQDGAGAGAEGSGAGGGLDAIVAAVRLTGYPNSPDWIDNFDLTEYNPITINDDGDVLEDRGKLLPLCANCTQPLKLSEAQKGPEERLWVLRCAHVVDQYCLEQLSTPQKEEELAAVIGGASFPPPRKRSRAKASTSRPMVYEWDCPVKGCGEAHRSEKKTAEGRWVQREHEGATPIYM